MRIGAMLLVLLISLPATAASFEEEVDAVMPVFADLAAKGGYGVMPFERAAFIIREHDGSYTCRLWSSTGEFMRASTSAAIPAGTVAIAHTHPRTSPRASRHDREEAMRLGIAIVVVGRDSVEVIDAAGNDGDRRTGIAWRGWADPMRTCG